MADLEKRFRSLERSSAPDLWSDASTRRPGPPPQPPAGRRIVAGVVALALAAAATFGVAIAFRHSAPRPAAPVVNGKIAFARGGPEGGIYAMDADGTGVRRLTSATGDTHPAWSPDGSKLAFVRYESGQAGIYVVNADGSDPRRLTSGDTGSSPSWSPDGTKIAFALEGDHNAEIAVMNADGSGVTRLTDDPSFEYTPAWSPDGSRVVFVAFTQPDSGAPSPLHLSVMNADGSGMHQIGPDDAALPAWSPDGKSIVFVDTASGSLSIIGADGMGSHELVDLTPITQGRGNLTTGPTWSPDGSLIAFATGATASESHLYVVNADGSGLRELSSGSEYDASPDWQSIVAEPVLTGTPSPMALAPKMNGAIYFRIGGGDGGSWIDSILADGTARATVFPIDAGPRYARISFSADGSRIAYDDAPNGLVTADPDGTDAVHVTDGVNDSWPVWSPDGSRIAFSSTRDDLTIEGCEAGFPHEFRCPTDIYVMDADGTNVERLTDHPAGEFMPTWSPDGSRIAFVREGDPASGTYEGIYTMNPDGTDVRRISSSNGGSDFWPSWSPDGSKLVFAAIRNEDWGIWVVNADGSDEHMILGGTGAGYVDDPVWSPDGTLIAFVGNMTVDDYSPEDALYVMHPDGTGAMPIADAPRYGVAGDIAWQPIPAGTTASTLEAASVEVRVTTTQGVADFPSAVAFGEGGAWVTSCCTDGTGSGEVVRLDPATGEVVARIPVRAVPGWDFGGAGLTVASGGVWTLGSARTGGGCCDGVVTRIDPATNAIVDEIAVPGITEGDLWVGGDTVYVLGFTPNGGGLDLARVDITTHEIVWRTTVPGQWSQTVFVAGGSVWVLGTGRDAHGPVVVTTWYRFDPSTGALLDALELPPSEYIPAVHANTVWYRTADGMQLLDVSSGQLVGDVVRPGPGCCVGPVVSDGAGGVWVVSSPGGDRERSIWHIDASGTIVASGAIEDKATYEQMLGQSYAFDPATQTIWVQHYEDSIARVEITLSSGGA